jgi:hypothetical protein
MYENHGGRNGDIPHFLVTIVSTGAIATLRPIVTGK